MVFLEDLRHYQRFCYPGQNLAFVLFRSLIAHPAILALMWFRFGNWCKRLPVPLIKHFLLSLHWIGFIFVRAITGVQLLPGTRIGPGLVLLHYGTTIINPRSVVGKNCVFFNNVLLAADSDMSSPNIGDDVMIGANVTIFGKVIVGSGVKIGAGAVVVHSIPDDSTAVGVPARVVRSRHGV